ncbi:MAG: hypothetical protein ACRENE_02515 [Polyangiaceae bacterium]
MTQGATSYPPPGKHLNLHLAPLEDASPGDHAGATSPLLTDANAVNYLSPEGLMAYCQSRLDSIDGQAQGIFAQQQKRNGEISDINSVLQSFQQYTGGIKGDTGTCQTLATNLSDLIGKLKTSDPGCPELPKLTQLYNDVLWSGSGPADHTVQDPPYIDSKTYPPAQVGDPGDGTFGTDEMQSFIDRLQGCASDLNSNSELQMIQLQSLMSERQTAIELTTNLVQSLGSQSEKIAQNVGH